MNWWRLLLELLRQAVKGDQEDTAARWARESLARDAEAEARRAREIADRMERR